MKKIELLNSEGAILTAHKVNENFVITDRYKEVISILSKDELYEFTRGNLDITDSKQKNWCYSQYPGTMKPDLKKLDEFIGLDTTKFIY